MNVKTFGIKDNELPSGCEVQNEMIENIDLNFIAHYGVVSLCVNMSNRILFSEYNLTLHCGCIMKFLTELLEIQKEDGLLLSEIEDVPCRIIVKDREVIAIGHWMKDKFVNIEELIRSMKDI